MLCAHTVRRLKPGTLDQFLETFRPQDEDLPGDFQARRAAIEPYVEAVLANGIYDVAATWTPEAAATA
jgi:hypothetical protein